MNPYRNWLTQLFSSPRRPVRRTPTARLRLELLEDRLAPATFTVVTTADGGAGSLRDAITLANSTFGADTIAFNLPGSGVQVINPLTPLPNLTDSVTIDGTTQQVNNPLVTVIVVDGAALQNTAAGATTPGFTFTANNNVIRGLTVGDFGGSGLVFQSSSSNTVEKMIVVDNGRDGLTLLPGSHDDTIGGSALNRNVFSGNARDGIMADGTFNSTISFNYIGVNAAGDTAHGNGSNGIGMFDSAAGNTVASNVISGNALFGLLLLGQGTSNNNVDGNTIGLNAAGTAALGNALDGIHFSGGASANKVGNTSRNFISGNGRDGVQIVDPQTISNLIKGNSIGTDVTGAFARGNALEGVAIFNGAANNTVQGNIISANGRIGVLLSDQGTTGNTIGASNIIGLDATGSAALGNAFDGVFIAVGASSNTINGNVIAANGRHGVFSIGQGCDANSLTNNTIGTDGVVPFGNAFDGVALFSGTTNTTITGNTISANGAYGVSLYGSGVSFNTLDTNKIGVNSSASAALGNVLGGVFLGNGASSNKIGTSAGGGNIISGNLANGVLVQDSGTTGNSIQKNTIGLNAATGTTILANSIDGIAIANGATNTAITANTISGNGRHGVSLTGVGTSGNTLFNSGGSSANFIGTTSAAATTLGNTLDGVFVGAGASNNSVGAPNAAAFANVIEYNHRNGITVSDPGTNGNAVLNNIAEFNSADGLVILNGASSTGVGAAPAGSGGNLVAFNIRYGIRIDGASNDTVQGNTVTTNGQAGVFFTGGAANNTVGGPGSGVANTISGNGGDGVLIGSDPTRGFNTPAGAGNQVAANTFSGNTGDLIDLGPNDGATANDSGDADTGPNDLQNFPTVAAIGAAGTAQVLFTLNSLPNTTFRLDIYQSTGAGSASFIVSETVTTDGAGNATLTLSTANGLVSGRVTLASATNLGGPFGGFGDTSELLLTGPAGQQTSVTAP